MIIIVEGIDRVGKTTLCKKLSDLFKTPIFKHKANFEYSKMDNDNETDKMMQLLDLCELTNSSIIFDRFQLSDYIYGVIERKYDKLNAGANRLLIENKLKNMNTFLVLVTPTNVNESSRQHGKDLSIYNDLFSVLFYKSEIKRKIQCDYNSFEDVVNFINEELNKKIELGDKK